MAPFPSLWSGTSSNVTQCCCYCQGKELEEGVLEKVPLPVNTPPLPEGAGGKRWNVNVMVTLILDDHPFKIGLKDPPPDIQYVITNSPLVFN